jgi:hypothetical protein
MVFFFDPISRQPTGLSPRRDREDTRSLAGSYSTDSTAFVLAKRKAPGELRRSFNGNAYGVSDTIDTIAYEEK